ncbi:MAG: general stress protein [Chloroflexota bacterium]
MTRIFGLFDTRAQAEDAAQRLLDAGVPPDALTIVAHDERRAAVGAADQDQEMRVAEGAATGGVLGLLAGIGLVALPALGPALVFGAPLTAAAGAVLGGATGATPGVVDPASDARIYAEGVRRGGTLVSAEIADERAAESQAILRDVGAVDIPTRMKSWQKEGWTPPEAPAEPYDAFGEYWSESSKLGTGGGTLAGAATGAAIGAMGGPVGALIGGIAGAAAGGSIGALGDYAGEAAQREREKKEEQDGEEHAEEP